MSFFLLLYRGLERIAPFSFFPPDLEGGFFFSQLLAVVDPLLLFSIVGLFHTTPPLFRIGELDIQAQIFPSFGVA